MRILAFYSYEQNGGGSSYCVFLRIDRVRQLQELLYAGLYMVLKRTSKVFKFEIDCKQHTVSIERLKPAHLFPAAETMENPSVVPTCDVVYKYDRRSRQVVRFQCSLSS
ncbi:hypothetical protein NPIL_166961 [Nephila pilipes]|uniref:Uncharacterized protein n=1 Tax=Nephila pilipes TaxID=299642 RepID=A0A8X6MVQ4_NEPPI|nr:hypothetical protein NPIL_166961 [Nephila pilipes]